MTAAGAACTIEQHGPQPTAAAVWRDEQGYPAEAVICSARDSRLAILGDSLTPMPSGVLTGEPQLTLPAVYAVDSAGARLPLSVTGVDAERGGALLVTVLAGTLTPGLYDVAVENPGGADATLATALEVVPPPRLDTATPTSAPSYATFTIDAVGGGFRVAGDGARPTLALVPTASGAALDLTNARLVAADTLAAEATTAPPGTYDLIATNPDGCAAVLAAALTISAPPPLQLCSAVTPSLASIAERTAIELCALTPPTDGAILVTPPELLLLVDADGDGTASPVPLLQEAIVGPGAGVAPGAPAGVTWVMTAVIPAATEPAGAGLVAGGPYDIEVVTTDGARGTIAGALTLVAQRQPHLTGVSPEQVDMRAQPTLRLFGSGFVDPSPALAPRRARVLLVRAGATVANGSGGACEAPACFECVGAALVSDAEIRCAPPFASLGVGRFAVRYEELGTTAFATYEALTVTDSSGDLAAGTTTMASLRVPRFGHAALLLHAGLGERLAYVIGGQTGNNVESAVASIEVARVSLDGTLGPWRLLAAALPAPRSGAAVAALDDDLFVVGGRDAAGQATSDVWRAHLLARDSAPATPTAARIADVASRLAVGSYRYVVAAVAAQEGDVGAGVSEGLASDPIWVHAGSGERVHLSWQPVAGAVSYRVYRSPQPNDCRSLALLAADLTAAELDDDGALTPDATRAPLAFGALGAFVPMPSLGSPRAEAAAVIAADPSGALHLYVTGGRTGSSSGAALDTFEALPLTLTDGVPHSQAPTASGSMGERRAEHLIAVVDGSNTPGLSGTNDRYLVVAQGADGSAVRSGFRMARIGADGVLSAFADTDAPPSRARAGAVGALVSGRLFSLTGRNRDGSFDAGGLSAALCGGDVCPSGSMPTIGWTGGSVGLTLGSGLYRSGLIYGSGYFYIVGGLTAAGSVTGDTQQGHFP